MLILIKVKREIIRKFNQQIKDIEERMNIANDYKMHFYYYFSVLK